MYDDNIWEPYFGGHCDLDDMDDSDIPKFFTNNLAIVCADIHYLINFDDYTPPDFDFRRELWFNRTSAFNDCVLKVAEKDIKVGCICLDSN
jgi:hypothetical protein